MSDTDTIVAVATPPGRGGIGVLRLSGPSAFAIAEHLSGGSPPVRSPRLVDFRDASGEAIDRGLLLAFKRPASFTGEDVVELHAHGAPIVLAALLARCIELGARSARPGEFSERAFHNGKLDLAQAEAVADLVAAGSEAAARAALRSLSGVFSRRVDAILEALVSLRVYVEAALDFPEEEIDFLREGEVAARVRALSADVGRLHADAARGVRLRDGLHVVLLGSPNAGKSTLLNALAGEDRAIVTEIPGTTRDLLREPIDIDGVAVTVVDTAGLRKATDAVEAEGVRRAREEAQRADLAVLVIDTASTAQQQEEPSGVPAGVPLLRVYSKIDLLDEVSRAALPVDAIALSAHSGEGMDALRQHLRASAGLAEGSDGTFSARARHLDALTRVAANLDAAIAHAESGQGELLAEELRQAQQALGEITGTFTSDQLLGEIFASFCIGK